MPNRDGQDMHRVTVSSFFGRGKGELASQLYVYVRMFICVCVCVYIRASYPCLWKGAKDRICIYFVGRIVLSGFGIMAAKGPGEARFTLNRFSSPTAPASL